VRAARVRLTACGPSPPTSRNQASRHRASKKKRRNKTLSIGAPRFTSRFGESQAHLARCAMTRCWVTAPGNLPVQPKTASSRLPGRPPYIDGMVTISAQAYPIGQSREALPEPSLLDDGAAGKVVTLRSEIKHAPDDEEHHRN
jgi:hypothetical protein